MVLRTGPLALSLLLAASAFASLVAPATAGAQPRPLPGEIDLPLADYQALSERAAAADREKARLAAEHRTPLAEVLSQRTAVAFGDSLDEVEVRSDFTVLVVGQPKGPLFLPLAGVAERIVVRPGAGATVAATPDPASGGLQLVASVPGRYEVEVHGRAPLARSAGITRLVVPPAAAPVGAVEVELAADLAWSSPGSVVVADRTQGGRRRVELSARRGEVQIVEVRRTVGGGEAEARLAQSVVLTILELRPDGPRRRDLVLYEVSRGALTDLTVELPPGLVADQVATDSGTALPTFDGRRLTVRRDNQLRGTGYLVVTSTPLPGSPGTPLALGSIVPEPPVRARYLAITSSIAATASPLPAASWARVDVGDLPQALADALRALDLTAAWRLTGDPASALSLDVAALPAATSLPTLVQRRETTTLVTVDGTVLHRDRFVLGQAGVSLDLVLPAGARLWSATVGDEAVRPLVRGGVLSVPLGLRDGDGPPPAVEVAVVLERAIPSGRSRLSLELPQVVAPVLEHRWRLLLPEGSSYRFASGDLQPAPQEKRPMEATTSSYSSVTSSATYSAAQIAALPLARDGNGVVGGVAAAPPPADVPIPVPEPRPAPGAMAKTMDAVGRLDNGLVGGVKPLAVSIPEAGKELILTGVLPPARVAVELDVKGKR